jgi:AraC-like DNA-binding protein
LRDAGIDPTLVMLEAGLTVEEEQKRKRRIDARALLRVLERAAQELHDDWFGFHLALNFELGEIGLLYYVMASSERLTDALRNAERYCAINNEGVRLRISSERSLTIAIEYLNLDRSSDRHHIEFWLVTLVRICRTVTSSRLAPKQIKLRHRRSKTTPDVRSFLGCEIEFEADNDEISFPHSTETLPIVGADVHLNRLLVEYADEAIAKRASRRAGIRFHVEDQIVQLLPHGAANASEIARRLGMSRRTLARALSSEGVTFSDVLDTMRQALSQRYLREHQLPISKVAWLLGYSDVSSFTHAFVRWSGMTPKAYRNSEGAR